MTDMVDFVATRGEGAPGPKDGGAGSAELDGGRLRSQGLVSASNPCALLLFMQCVKGSPWRGVRGSCSPDALWEGSGPGSASSF